MHISAVSHENYNSSLGSEGDLSVVSALLKRALVRPSNIGSLENCKKLSVLMPRDLHRDLKTFAFRHQTTITDLILACVVELLALEEQGKLSAVDDGSAEECIESDMAG